jgi:hypothetical protein
VITFEIELNGQSLVIVGAEDLSVLTAIVSAVGKLGRDSQGAREREKDNYIELTVCGLTSRAEHSANVTHVLVFRLLMWKDAAAPSGVVRGAT